MKRALAFAAVLAAVAAVAPPSSAQARGVRVDDNFFDPVFIVVEVGTTVEWQNVGAAPHSVTPQRGSNEPRDSNPDCTTLTFIACMQPGERHRWTFNTAGTFTYYCRVHGDPTIEPDPNAAPDEQPCGMCGTVRVTAGPVRSPSPSPTAPPRATPTVTPRPGPTVTVTPTGPVSPGSPTTPSPSPSPTVREQAQGGGGGARAGLAVLGVVVLGGAGYLVWRLFIAAR